MNCTGCQYLGRSCGGGEGDPVMHTVDPMSLSSHQLIELACAVARIGNVICALGGVGQGARFGPSVDEPYIWDIKE